MTTTSLPASNASDQKNSARTTKSFTRHLPTIARALMGFFFLMSGIVGLMGLTPPSPPSLPEAAIAFNTGLVKTGYMMPLIFGTQAVVGSLLLVNRFVPLALALIAPFFVNSFAFHVFLVPSGLGIVIFLLALELYLVWTCRETYRPMLTMRVTPNARPVS